MSSFLLQGNTSREGQNKMQTSLSEIVSSVHAAICNGHVAASWRLGIVASRCPLLSSGLDQPFSIEASFRPADRFRSLTSSQHLTIVEQRL